MNDEKRAEERDPGEYEQNVAIAKGLTDAPIPVKEVVVHPGKCPMCGRDKANT
jgi:hypothetical protein